MIDPLGDIRARISTIESLVRRFQGGPQPTAPAPAQVTTRTPSSASPTFRSTLDQVAHQPTPSRVASAAGIASATSPAIGTTSRPRAAREATGPASLTSIATTVPAATIPTTSIPDTSIPDARWTDILTRDAAYLAAGAHGPTSATDLNPLYAGSYGPDVEARRRADGSLNPNDLPSSKGLTADQLLQARLAESVPNAVLATGQNEGVARPGQVENLNDSYDLLAWIGQLRAMKGGTIPPLVQDNGYTWTSDDIQRNLDVALSQARQNKEVYNLRWQTRWTMLRANGLGEIADREQASVQLADLNAPI